MLLFLFSREIHIVIIFCKFILLSQTKFHLCLTVWLTSSPEELPLVRPQISTSDHLSHSWPTGVKHIMHPYENVNCRHVYNMIEATNEETLNCLSWLHTQIHMCNIYLNKFGGIFAYRIPTARHTWLSGHWYTAVFWVCVALLTSFSTICYRNHLRLVKLLCIKYILL